MEIDRMDRATKEFPSPLMKIHLSSSLESSRTFQCASGRHISMNKDFGVNKSCEFSWEGSGSVFRAMLAGFEWQPERCTRLFAGVALHASSVLIVMFLLH